MASSSFFFCLLFIGFSFQNPYISEPEGYDYCQANLLTDSEVQRITERMDVGLKLVQVQMLTRHGDRAPIEYLHSPNYEDTAVWDCKLERLSYENYGTNYTTQNRLTSERYMPGRQANLGNCGMGALTQKGASQHIDNGEKFRKMYVDAAGLLPVEWDDSVIYVRSGDELRLVESAQSIFIGLYPPKLDNPKEERQPIDLIDGSFDNMTPDIKRVCPTELKIEDFEKNQAAYQNFTIYKNNMTDQLDAIFDGSVSLGGVADLIRCRSCHGFDTTYGGLLSQDMIDEILQLDLYDFTFFPNNTAANRLGMGSFLWEMLNYFEEHVNGQNEFRFLLFSGHDSSVWPFLGMLNVYDGMWPPLASHVVFEFWENSNGEYFIEIIYNGRTITKYMPGCGGADTCSYTVFKKLVDPVTVNLDEFWRECRTDRF